jgi:hypothetical protein
MIAFRGHVIAAYQRLPKTDSAALMRLSWSASSTPIATVPSLPPRQIDYATDLSHQPWPCAQGARGQPKPKACISTCSPPWADTLAPLIEVVMESPSSSRYAASTAPLMEHEFQASRPNIWAFYYFCPLSSVSLSAPNAC